MSSVISRASSQLNVLNKDYCVEPCNCISYSLFAGHRELTLDSLYVEPRIWDLLSDLQSFENWSRIDDRIGVENRCREESERTGWSASGCLPEQVRLSEEGTHNLG